MAFPINTGIPASTNNPSVDQPGMQTNFSNIASFLAVDHVNPSSSGAGQHKQVDFNANIAAPPLIGVSNLYANLVSGLSQLFYQNSAGSTQLTNLTVSNSGTNYGILTPWGIKINWGSLTTGTGGAVVNFQVPFSNTNYCGLATAYNTGAAVSATVENFNNGNMKVFINTGSAPALYFAIGT